MQHAFEQLVEKLGWFCVTFEKSVMQILKRHKKTQASQKYNAETKHDTYFMT
jgi:hypothetical protein